MKGTFFSNPLEWNLETFGESWSQGQTISGVISIKNHSKENIKVVLPGVALCFGEIKKVHSRDKNALKPDTEFLIPLQEITASSTHEFHFNLALPKNSQISDKKKSYFLTYGQNYLESSLELKIEPHPLFPKVVQLLENFYRFKIKEIKSSKEGVEFHLLPPSSREFSSVEILTLGLSFNEDRLGLDFKFNLKKLNFEGISTKITKEKNTINKILSPKDFYLEKDLINQDNLLKQIDLVLNEVRVKNN